MGYTWTSTDGSLNTTTGTFIDSVDTGGENIFLIGTDLRNYHPIGVQYGGGGVSGGLLTTRDTDFTTPVRIGTQDRWYVDNPLSGTSGQFDKWDFKLYTRDTTGWANNPNNGAGYAGEKEPYVECGSCHDPHFETTTFLRMPGTVDTATGLGDGTTTVAAANQSNTGSRVCLTCHAK